MSQDEFTKLFKYMQDFRKELNDKFERTSSKEDLDKLTNAVDAYAKKVDDYTQDIADSINMNRETASRALELLFKEELLGQKKPSFCSP